MSQQKPLQYVVKEFEPEYITTEDDFAAAVGVRADFLKGIQRVPAVRGYWRCPYCQLPFERRKLCARHMGLIPNMPASCRVLLAREAERRLLAKINSPA